MPTKENYEDREHRADAEGRRIGGLPIEERAEAIQEVVANDPENTPKGEGAVVGGVPIGSDPNAGRNDAGLGAPPPVAESLPQPTINQKAVATESLDKESGSTGLKSKATQQTVSGSRKDTTR